MERNYQVFYRFHHFPASALYDPGGNIQRVLPMSPAKQDGGMIRIATI